MPGCEFGIQTYGSFAGLARGFNPLFLHRVVVFLEVAPSETSLGQGVAPILLQRSLKEGDGVVSVPRLIGTLQVAQPLHIEIVSVEVGSAVSGQLLGFLRLKPDVQHVNSAR